MRIISNCSEIIADTEHGIVNPDRAKLMLDKLVIDLTYQCDLKCNNCNRLCGIFPRKKHISLEYVKQLITDSIEQKKQWFRIIVAGGEPSLYSQINQFYQIIEIYTVFYKKAFPDSSIEIIHTTNGYSKKSQKVIDQLPNFVSEVYNTSKTNSEPLFQPMTVAPKDFGMINDKEISVCTESWGCGICINYRGFYPCAESAAINDILIEEDLSIKSLIDVNFESMAKILKRTCKYCGYYFEPYGFKKSSELLISKTWNDCLKKSRIVKRNRETFF